MIATLRAQARNLLQRFRKPKVTFSLILILLALYVLGLLIPQKVFFDSKEHYESWLAASRVLRPVLDFLGFTEIYTSPVTIMFLALFYANLILVVFNRIPVILKKTMVFKQSEPVAFSIKDLKCSPRCREFDLGGIDKTEAGSRIASFFRRRAWFVRQSDGFESTLAVRNRFSAFGFLLFHLSFLLCLTGGLTIYYTRFSGKIALTEGEAFEGNLQQFYAIDRQPKVLRELPELSFRLEKAIFEYEDRQPSRLDAVMNVRSGDKETTERIGVNQPVERGAYSILALNVGVSPLFVVRDTDTGAELDGAWVRLDASDEREDMFRFDALGDLDLYAKFYADYVIENGTERTRTLNIRNPAFRISARQKDRVIAEQTLRKGESMVLGPYLLEFRDLRRWVDFQVVREMGAGPLVLGFALAVIGLTMRLVFYRKEIRIFQQGGRVWLDGTSEYYQHSFAEELDQLADTLSLYIKDRREEVVRT
jgi:cytochrome c biogenesis protein ResB